MTDNCPTCTSPSRDWHPFSGGGGVRCLDKWHAEAPQPDSPRPGDSDGKGMAGGSYVPPDPGRYVRRTAMQKIEDFCAEPNPDELPAQPDSQAAEPKWQALARVFKRERKRGESK